MGTELPPYGALVAQHGLSESHRLLVDEVAAGSNVLDVGCATGYLAEQLKVKGCTVTGVELNQASAELAKAHCEQVVVGDFTNGNVRLKLTDRPFDYVLFGDVLEHLTDPESALLAGRELLATDGRVVVSVPNVAVWFSRRMLLFGRFEYSDHGTFDRTHLRFFTRKTARELVTGAGFTIERERFVPAPLPGEAVIERLRREKQAGRSESLLKLRGVAAQRWPEFFALQFVFTLRRE